MINNITESTRLGGSRGMIRARGPGFKSRPSPVHCFLFTIERYSFPKVQTFFKI